jgi:ABC-type amino acid transport system permease subunit
MNIFKDFFFIVIGIKYVIFFSFLGFIGGLLIAIFLTILNFNNYFKWLIKFYISIFRGIPLICQIAAFIYVGPYWFSVPFICFLVFSLNTSAYLFEVFRTFIKNLPSEQIETAKGIGLNKYQIIRYIIFPQMFQSLIPLFIAELISLSKDVALLSGFGILEIFHRGKIIGSNNYNYGKSMIFVAIIYYIYCYLLSQLEYNKTLNKYINLK